MTPAPSPYIASLNCRSSSIYTLSLHDALPISQGRLGRFLEEHPSFLQPVGHGRQSGQYPATSHNSSDHRSEEHTSELQSLRHLVCRLLLEKKNMTMDASPHRIHMPASVLRAPI